MCIFKDSRKKDQSAPKMARVAGRTLLVGSRPHLWPASGRHSFLVAGRWPVVLTCVLVLFCAFVSREVYGRFTVGSRMILRDLETAFQRANVPYLPIWTKCILFEHVTKSPRGKIGGCQRLSFLFVLSNYIFVLFCCIEYAFSHILMLHACPASFMIRT